MTRKSQANTLVIIRLIGAVIGSLGFFFIAFGRPIIGGCLVGIGTILLALAGGTQ